MGTFKKYARSIFPSFNSNQWRNNDKCQHECRKRHVCGKDYIWNPATGSWKNGKYLASIMDNSMITVMKL